jgi:hypothetical protein
MSEIAKSEWYLLKEVQRFGRSGGLVCTLAPLCEVQPSHGYSIVLMAHPSGKAICLCKVCEEEVNEIHRKINELEKLETKVEELKSEVVKLKVEKVKLDTIHTDIIRSIRFE